MPWHCRGASSSTSISSSSLQYLLPTLAQLTQFMPWHCRGASSSTSISSSSLLVSMSRLFFTLSLSRWSFEAFLLTVAFTAVTDLDTPTAGLHSSELSERLTTLSFSNLGCSTLRTSVLAFGLFISIDRDRSLFNSSIRRD